MFKYLEDRETADAADALFSCIWDMSILEFSMSLHTRLVLFILHIEISDNIRQIFHLPEISLLIFGYNIKWKNVGLYNLRVNF